ncbi:hypothetical protein B9Z44_14490 [Limnohabitans curvus]|uniref:DUF2726 domain-containing protein n=2 Tax=Limnohabitans curvus TaxID=323423 RepID=A0A315EGM6_9BURK|nr:hypothetical protein B9Z44_14490 [Limnohabitans curvus]
MNEIMKLNTELIALGLLFFCLIFFALIPRKPYKRAEFLFTPAERIFYKHLVRAVNGDYLVFGKVRVADLITIKGKYGSKSSMRDLAKVAQKHVDFCLCHPETLAVICAIELNDKSHDRLDRKSRDGFLDKVCKDVGLPLVWIKAQNNYNMIEIRQSIKVSIESVAQTNQSNPIYNPKEFRKQRP